ncbi:MAG: thermonuclease family protein [Proteobacteria bacterium]|nr:thermonuclease family protein [Pseudomonadota bacterium]
MVKTIHSILFLFATNSFSAINEGELTPENSSKKVSAKILYCSDGDTCRVKVGEGNIWFNARLFGIDAPETAKSRRKTPGQPFGDQAKNYLNEAIQGKEVLILQTDLDPFNRPVIEIYLPAIAKQLETNINLKLIEEGYAEVYRGKTKRIDKQPYFDAETTAKSKKLGIWSQKDYQSPSSFRKGNH